MNYSFKTASATALLILGLGALPSARGSSSMEAVPQTYSPYAIFLGNQTLQERIRSMRANITQRRNEVVGFVGKDDDKQDKLTVGYDEILAQLEKLETEQDPDVRENLAREVLELDSSLKTEGGARQIETTFHHFTSLLRTWSIPRKSPLRMEATDLMDPDSNEPLQPEAYTRLDLSTLDPLPNSVIWRRPKDISDVDLKDNFYNGGTPLFEGIQAEFPDGPVYFKKTKKSQGSPKLSVYSRTKKGKKKEYVFKFGRETYADPTVSSLMALLGYSTRVGKHIPLQKIYLVDQTLDEFKADFMSYYSPERLMQAFDIKDYVAEEGTDDGGTYIVLKQGELEFLPKQHLHVGNWGYNSLGHDGLREVRALMIFNLWISNTDIRDENTKVVLKSTDDGYQLHMMQHDSSFALGGILNEKTERFYYDLVKKKVTWADFFKMNPEARNLLRSKSDRDIVFTHIGFEPNPLAGKITYNDGKWMTRLIAQITRAQIEDAVALGGWPESDGKLLTEKLIERRNDLVRAFDLETEYPLIPADRHLTTPDGAVKDGHLVNGNFEGYPQNFSNYDSALLAPVRLGLEQLAISGAQMGIGTYNSYRIEGVQFGINNGLIAEVIAGLGRTITARGYPTGDQDVWGKRQAPTSDQDRYLVEDTVKLGYRGGFGYLVLGDATLTVQYRLVQTARTYADALLLNRKVIDFTLPYEVLKDKLPKKYVLMREIFLETAGRIQTLPSDDIISLGAEGSLSHVTLSRVVVDHKSPSRVVLSEDQNPYYQKEFQGIISFFGHIRIPFLTLQDQFKGKIDGASYTITDKDFKSDPHYAQAVSNVVSTGSFFLIQQLKKPVIYKSPVRRFRGHLSLLSFASWDSEFDSERISIDDQNTGENKSIIQHRALSKSAWSFLDNGESQQVNVFTSAPDKGKDGSVSDARIEVEYKIQDADAWSDEIDQGYFKFIREIALDDPKNPQVLPFTPELHSRNNRYDALNVFIAVQYCGPFLAELENLKPSEYWKSLASTLHLSEDQFRKAYNEFAHSSEIKGAQRLMQKPNPYEAAIWHSQLFLRELKAARTKTTTYEKLEYLTRALKKANYLGQYTFQSPIMATLNRLSHGSFFLHAQPMRPHDQQSYFPGDRDPKPVDIGTACPGSAADQILLFPLDAEELWTMYDWVGVK